MTKLTVIHTTHAPAAIGAYSQAIQAGNTVYLSGQIPLDPTTGLLIKGDMTAQVTRVFENLKTVAEAAGGSLNEVTKLTVYLTDLASLAVVNEVMPRYFVNHFPARTSFGVMSLPKGASVEVDAIMVL